MEKSERIAETARFLKWTQKYGGWWYLVCTPEEEHMTIETMNRIVQKLAAESFYEMIFVLLMVHRNQSFAADAIRYIERDCLIRQWETGSQKIIAELLDYLQ